MTPRTVDIYKLNPDQKGSPSFLNETEKRTLTQLDKEQASRFVNIRSQIKSILSHYLSIPLEEFTFIYGEYGKPEINPKFKLALSWSHGTHTSLLALTHKTKYTDQIGMDLEDLAPKKMHYAMAQNYFNSIELESFNTQWDCLEPKEQTLLFYKYWTAKEAYVKYCGKTLLQGFPQCNFDSIEKKITSRFKEPLLISQRQESTLIYSIVCNFDFKIKRNYHY